MTASEPTPTSDLVTVLGATRAKLGEVIDPQTAGVRPSPPEWLLLLQNSLVVKSNVDYLWESLGKLWDAVYYMGSGNRLLFRSSAPS